MNNVNINEPYIVVQFLGYPFLFEFNTNND